MMNIRQTLTCSRTLSTTLRPCFAVWHLPISVAAPQEFGHVPRFVRKCQGVKVRNCGRGQLNMIHDSLAPRGGHLNPNTSADPTDINRPSATKAILKPSLPACPTLRHPRLPLPLNITHRRRGPLLLHSCPVFPFACPQNNPISTLCNYEQTRKQRPDLAGCGDCHILLSLGLWWFMPHVCKCIVCCVCWPVCLSSIHFLSVLLLPLSLPLALAFSTW